jgi:hypothetical protein
MASAENVVDITAMPAMPGTMTCRLASSSAKIAPNRARKSSGSRKLKNAALGLRQNILRSSRYWRHAARRHATCPAAARAGRGGSSTWPLTPRPAPR